MPREPPVMSAIFPSSLFIFIFQGFQCEIQNLMACRLGTKFEQDLAAAIRFQRLLERFLELLERVHLLHCGGERSISYEVAQLLVNLLDLCARRVAYPIDEPESVEAKTTVDEVFGRDGRELPTLHAVDDNRAASFERLGQLAHGSSTHRIEDKTEFLPAKSLLNIFV